MSPTLLLDRDGRVMILTLNRPESLNALSAELIGALVQAVRACDVVIAASTARFADTHVRVGLLPGWGISQRLARQIGPQRAKEMSLSGNFVDAQRAFDIGLVTGLSSQRS